MFGLKNTIDPQYPDIIWFKLGTYIITNFSYSYSTAGMNISISGKDKMCLINGDVSGAIYASVDFGTREEVDATTGEKILVDINIEDIIREAVHEHAREPWERIIIKDLPKYGLFLLEWIGDTPLYVLIPTTGVAESVQVISNQDTEVYVDRQATAISELDHYLTTNDLTLVDKSLFTIVKMSLASDISYFVCRILPNQSAGYDVTELTYPRNGEESGLVSGVGDSVTSILDKIIEFLGDYEYFYDVDGNFIFQKKNKYVDTNWNVNDFNTTSMGNDYDLTAYLQSTWLFEGNELVVSINNTPNLNNIKNDYAIWGERQAGDDTIPIHMRYAVDKKPQFYKSIFVSADELAAYKELYPEFENGFKNVDGEGNWPSKIYYTEELNDKYIYQKTEDTERLLDKKYFIKVDDKYEEWTEPLEEGIDYYEYTDLFAGIESYEVDWREVIYQMALDYRRFNHFDTFNARILQNNILPIGNILYPKGITGYEQYYVDLEGFWRYLYCPDQDSTPQGTYSGYLIKETEELDKTKQIFTKDKFSLSEPSSNVNYERYYVAKKTENGIDIPQFVKDYKKVDLEEQLNKRLMVRMAEDYSNCDLENWHYDGTLYDGYRRYDGKIYYSSRNKTNIMFDGANKLYYLDPDDRIQPAYISQTYKGHNNAIFYDNGSSNDLWYRDIRYLDSGFVTTTSDLVRDNFFNGAITQKYNLLIPLEKNVTLSELQNLEVIGDVNDPDNFNFFRYNPFTVYQTGEDEQYMLDYYSEPTDEKIYVELLTWDQSLPIPHYENYYNNKFKGTFKVKRVMKPTFDGIKYYDTGEYVYRISCIGCWYKQDWESVTIQSKSDRYGYRIYSNMEMITKIGIKDTLPSTINYSDLYVYDIIPRGEGYGYGLESINHVSSGEFHDNVLKYKIMNDNGQNYFNFLGTNEYKSLIYYLPDNTEPINITEIENHLKPLFYYNTETIGLYKQFNFINEDNLCIPILDEDQGVTFKHSPISYYQQVYEYEQSEESYLQQWNTLIEESPELLLFWFDFLDSQTSEIGKYGANNIMDRSKANNDSKVKAIYYRDTLNIVYQRLAGQDKKYDMLIDQARSGQNIIQAGAWVWDQFKVSSCGKSCKDVLDQWLQAYTQANESINFNCIPIYTLEPNNRISIQDDNTKINGEYVINSINIPLTFNGTMSVNATKAVSKLQ